MKLQVKNIRGKIFELEVPSYSLVQDLKKAINNVANVNSENQKLIFDGNRLLTNTKSLQEYGLKDGDTIVLLPVRSPPPPKFDVEPFPTKRSILEATSIYKTKDKPIRTAPRRTHLQDLLGSLTGFGSQPSSPSPVPSGPPQLPEIRPEILQQITDMGFPEARAKKALYLSNMNVGGAMDWLLEHGDDPDADNPLTPQQISQISRVHRLFAPRAPPPQTSFTPDQSAIQRLKDMGFSEEDSTAALKATNNDPDAATAWLLGEREEESSGTEIPIPLNSPILQMALSNPRVLTALRNVLQDPGSVTQYLADPEVGPVLLQLWSAIQRGN